MSKALGALIILLLGGAFFAGTRAQAKLAEPETAPHVAVATLAAPVAEAVTAEQVRTLIEDMRELRRRLETAATQVGELNARLARLEGACSKTCGGN